MEYFLFRALLATLRHTPRPLARWLGGLYGKLFALAVPRLAQIARRNLEIAGFGARPDIVEGVFASIGRILVTFARFPDMDRANIGEWIRYDGLEHFTEAKRRGRGVLFATAHLGNWELSAFAHGLLTEPMRVVVRPLDNPRVDEFVERWREMSANRVIAKKDAARIILRALKENRAVGILMDQNMLPDEGVFVDFFGVPACATPALARLAAHSGAVVIPGFALWSQAEGRYVLRFYPPVEMTGDAGEDTESLHRVLEGVIREHPDQWLWVHRRWKTRPPGAPALYK
jgi:Kdo2-lipid IVA lauroyltransferase/acyltransferase